MSASFLILGKGGQLGAALARLLGNDAHPLGMEEVNFTDKEFIKNLNLHTQHKNYRAVFNAAAYTLVDKAEGEGKRDAFRINAEAVGELAAWCKQRDLPLIHYSTDYVFNGSGSEPWCESDKPAPLSAYGISKLEGEQALMESGAKHLIFRTSWLYDAHGKNFFNTMLRLFAEKDSLNVVADQIGAPTYALHLASASLKAASAALDMKNFPSGVYHISNAGETSWHGFAQAIFALATASDSVQKSPIRCGHIHPIATSEYPLPAKRPLNSRLDNSKLKQIFGLALPAWELGLKECYTEKYAR